MARRLTGAAAGIGAIVAAGAAHAAPEPWGLYLQPAASKIAESIHSFSALTFWIITPITLLVLALLVIVMVKFNAKANPVPSKTSHNTTIEVIWTVAPIIILLIIAVPSFRLLYAEQTIPEADVTVKATANKWYWSYEYPEAEGLSFDSNMLADDQITDPATQPRLLATDYPLVVPVEKVVRIQVTASDVIHAFAMPTMGVKIDAMPGRLNETWFHAHRGACRDGRAVRHLARRGEGRHRRGQGAARRLPHRQRDHRRRRQLIPFNGPGGRVPRGGRRLGPASR
jgi:cytochrome c oxidase subunit 2